MANKYKKGDRIKVTLDRVVTRQDGNRVWYKNPQGSKDFWVFEEETLYLGPDEPPIGSVVKYTSWFSQKEFAATRRPNGTWSGLHTTWKDIISESISGSLEVVRWGYDGKSPSSDVKKERDTRKQQG
jgi:hypothetical protein